MHAEKSGVSAVCFCRRAHARMAADEEHRWVGTQGKHGWGGLLHAAEAGGGIKKYRLRQLGVGLILVLLLLLKCHIIQFYAVGGFHLRASCSCPVAELMCCMCIVTFTHPVLPACMVSPQTAQ